MTKEAWQLRLGAAVSDFLRDRKIPLPQGVTACRNLPYGDRGNRLDLYRPEGAGRLPVMVSIHGGGYVYGSKEVYRRYGMDTARRGFAFVNFNYRLAPKWKFPAPLEDTNQVMAWVCGQADRYGLDPDRVVLVGDSAGAQLASQYAAMVTNPGYARLFALQIPAIRLRGLGLFCGMYPMAARAAEPRQGILRDYLGDLPPEDPRFRVLEAIGEDYPPTFLATAYRDFLREEAAPMQAFLAEKGIPTVLRCYGSPEEPQVGHVFHVNLRLPQATACNDDACAFFRSYL